MVHPVGERSNVIPQLIDDYCGNTLGNGKSLLSLEGAKVIWNGFVVARAACLVQTLSSTVDTVESAFELAISTLRSAIFGLAFTNSELRQKLVDSGNNLGTDVYNLILSVVGVASPFLLRWSKNWLDDNAGGQFGTNKEIKEAAAI